MQTHLIGEGLNRHSSRPFSSLPTFSQPVELKANQRLHQIVRDVQAVERQRSQPGIAPTHALEALGIAQLDLLRTVIDINLPTSPRRSLSFAAWHAWDAARLFPSVSLGSLAERSRTRNRVHKTLDHDGLRLGGILSDIFGVNGRRILDGLVAGRPPRRILAGLTSHVAAKLEPLAQALAATLDPLALLKLQMQMEALDRAEALARRRSDPPPTAGTGNRLHRTASNVAPARPPSHATTSAHAACRPPGCGRWCWQRR